MKFFYKNKNRILTFVCFFILFVLFSPLILSSAIPKQATVTKSETPNLWIPRGMRWIVSVKQPPTKYVLGNNAQKLDKNSSTYNSTVYFGGILPIKSVEISVVEDKIVTLGGNVIGINLKTGGVLVVKIDKIKTVDGKALSPAKDAGLMVGDIIERVNGIEITKKEELSQIVHSGENPLKISGKRNGKNFECEIENMKDESGNNIIGVWVRDTVAGIGTVTFYSNGKFAALGHPILDIDTGKIAPAKDGLAFQAGIVGVNKGREGSPGAIKGIFTTIKNGEITSNTTCGIFGTATEPSGEKMPIAKKEEIRCKNAQIVCDIGEGVEKFDIEIQRILTGADSSKCMVIHITDRELIEKTGGIVQGMSGSPIIQDGKLVGAVTHVFVNDPTRGYGIFIENMLAEAEKIK